MSNSYGNVIAFSRFDYCGSQPGDGTGMANGRGILVMGGSAVVIGNSVYHCNRGIDMNTTGFMECRHCLLQESQNTSSGSGFTNPGGSSTYCNTIDCVANNCPCSGFRWKGSGQFYRSGNSGTGDCWYWPTQVPQDEWLECPDGAIEHSSPITAADTPNYLPTPAWLIENIQTPTDPNDVGAGTGPSQLTVAR